MATAVKSMARSSVDSFLVGTEVSVLRGQLMMLSIIGLPKQAVLESWEGVQTAIDSCGYDIPTLVLDIVPASVKTETLKALTYQVSGLTMKLRTVRYGYLANNQQTGGMDMATSSFVEKIRVNNPKVMEEYVAAMESAANTPVLQRTEKKTKEIKDSQELKKLMLKGIEKWGQK